MKNNRNTKCLMAATVAGLIFSSTASHAAVFTWTGATDGDWTNAANWDANGVPVDTDTSTTALDQQNVSDDIIITGTAPTTNIPTFSGGNPFGTKPNTPKIQMQSGTMSVDVNSWSGQGLVHNGFWSSSVGDNIIGNGLAVLNYNLTQNVSSLNRDNNGAMEWNIFADGTLNLTTTVSTLDMAERSVRTVGFNLAGGTVNINSALKLDGFAGNFFDITADGASVTANFGGDFADLAALNAAIAADVHFKSTTALALGAVDNTDGTFTVSVIPEPSTALLGALGLLALLRRRR